MTRLFGVMAPLVVGMMCSVLLFVAVATNGDTKTEAAAVSLLKKGKPVVPSAGAANMTEYLKMLAGLAGTEAVQSYLTREGRKTPAPATAGKAARPAFEWLAEAITDKPVSFEIDSHGRWCFYLHGDPDAKPSYAANGGTIGRIGYFSRRKTADRIWTLAKVIYDRDLAKDVVATQMDAEVVEAVNADGKKFPAKERGAKAATQKHAAARWGMHQLRILLAKAAFGGDLIAKLRVRAQVALRTGVATFTIKTLGHTKPVVITQSDVTVTVAPLKITKRSGSEAWGLTVEVRTKYAKPPGMISCGESVHFLADDGKRMRRTSWRGSHSKGRHKMVIDIKPHSLDPASTQMVIEYPTGLKILPIDLTFTNVAIRDLKSRPKR